MLKSVALLFVLGLALGLWVGFNPQAHEKVVQGWEGTKTFFVTMKTNASVSFQDWLTGIKSGEQNGTASVGVAWKQISSVFTTLWDSVIRFWSNLTNGLRLKS
ncbi:MAG TPA: hypothetical protein VHM28_06475 [Anaerolineales bacterium]|nr:hypothetical protein [Anaerolineales bacterium]